MLSQITEDPGIPGQMKGLTEFLDAKIPGRKNDHILYSCR